ncbi:hypothetical protein [Acidobacterium sp. S8]|uniref:hypothetical protein n=1 Tax=Acidobacterium sp. S8 TaxID=1641854 RepID=UPI00131B7273|nr:hypothetical protein [Acidobacterium sp. S8]
MTHSVPFKLFGSSAAKPLGRLLVLSSLAMALHSTSAFAANVCKNNDLEGAYVYSVDATSLTVPPVGPLAILGKITLDGKGNFAGTINGSIAGEILLEVPITGTYSIADDCTGSFTTIYPLFAAHFSLVLFDSVDHRKQGELLSIDAGTVGTGAVKPMLH